MHPEERREAWIFRRAEWWANRRVGKSSEDVWDIREYVLFPPFVFRLNDLEQRTAAQLSKTHHTRTHARENIRISLIP